MTLNPTRTLPVGTLALAVLLSGTTFAAAPAPVPRDAGRADLKRGTVQANGMTIAYESHGPEDREAVLLIMGIAAQLTAWPPELVDALVARGYRVIVYDHRDTGLSTKLDTAGAPDWPGIVAAKVQGKPAPVPYTLDDMARDAVGLLDALGVKAAHIVGASMGGYIAHLIAADHPERALSLTSVMSDTMNPALPQPSPEILKAFPTVERHGDPKGYADDMVRFWTAVGSPDYPTDEALIRQRALRDFERSYYPAGFVRQVAALQASGDQRPKLRTIKAPTVVVHGAADPIVSVEGGKDTAASIPGAELRVIPGMGHDLPLPLVGQVTDAITAAAKRARPRELPAQKR
jgi:pimeloyl-ACP methyl ester carboxylesterase